MEYTKEIEILNKEYRKLLGLLICDNPNQKELDEVLDNALPDNLSHEVLILLLYFQVKNPSLIFDERCSAEIKRIQLEYRHSFLRRISHFRTIASGMSQSGVSFALIKGGALQCLAPSFPRYMADIDVLVKNEDFNRSLKAAKRAGYRCCVDAHSADIHTYDSSEGVMDIHRYVPLTSGKGRLVSDDIIARSSEKVFCGISCLLPCKADLLFVAVTNFCRNMMDARSSAKAITAFLDFKSLISAGIDWNVFVEDCRKTCSMAEIAFMVSLVNSIVPGLFPKRLESLADDVKKNQFRELFLFRRELLAPLQKRRSGLRLWNVVVNPRKLPQYIIIRPLYLFLKLFKYSPSIAGTSFFVKIRNHLVSHFSL